MSEMINRLEQARDRGDLPEIAYQFARFLNRIEPEISEPALLAGCLAALRREEGDVCLLLKEEAGRVPFGGDIATPDLKSWVRELRHAAVVGEPDETAPLILDKSDRLYLQKYWAYETRLADALIERAGKSVQPPAMDQVAEELDRLFGPEAGWQKIAAWASLRNNLTVISGGPGTGKTTTVVRILLLMARLGMLRHGVLAAPTGKAASRLVESVQGALEQHDATGDVRERLPGQAMTIHRMLGARPGSGMRYNAENPLPYDLVVIDEASMIDLALMYRLVEALPGHARVILLGDKDQLASVEAGAVLGSICVDHRNRFSADFIRSAEEAGIGLPDGVSKTEDPGPLTDHIVLLQKSYRFGEGSGIGNLAGHILRAEPEQALKVLRSNEYPEVSLAEISSQAELDRQLMLRLSDYFDQSWNTFEPGEALRRVTARGILCVHRRGPLGAEQVNGLAERLLRRSNRIPAALDWYPGKPVMATQNDYTLGIRNGELGVTLRDEEGQMKVWFGDGEGGYRSFYPARLTHVETAYAVTVHKSQGSEYGEVALILPQELSPVCTRELLYTGVTRSRSHCVVIGSADVLAKTIERTGNRSSGLREKLWG